MGKPSPNYISVGPASLKIDYPWNVHLGQPINLRFSRRSKLAFCQSRMNSYEQGRAVELGLGQQESTFLLVLRPAPHSAGYKSLSLRRPLFAALNEMT